MSQEENIISTSAASAVELAKNQRKIIYKNIQKWHKLSDDTKEIYSDFCIDVCEYYAYKTKPPTYQLIKF
ncbi:hypothetical protein RhiirC2_781174 [Rhizophagus irregularis]|uniref:Uncharacterized protein n=1 Tax=Rhizophagus irregularis TaxID=588596 RepID=A0A2N1N630_9GLOM|nr:hypothetical protein RhiirC2_781174 [Rhizophagus irregularis]